MAITQLQPTALPGRRYGAFAGKEATSEPAGPHNPGLITQLTPIALPGRRYGSFAGKEASAEPEPTGQVGSVGGWVRHSRRQPRRRRFILPDGTIVWATFAELEELLSQFIEVEVKQPKKRRRKAKAEPEKPLIKWGAIKYQPLPDASVETLRPILPPLMSWGPDRAKLEMAVRAFKRRQDDEEAMFALGL